MEKILEKASQLTDEREKRLADSVLQVCVAANSRIVEELKEENLMCQALREIMKPELEEMEKRGEKRAILVMIKALRQLGQADDDIKGIIIKNFHLKQTEVEEYIQQSVSWAGVVIRGDGIRWHYVDSFLIAFFNKPYYNCNKINCNKIID